MNGDPQGRCFSADVLSIERKGFQASERGSAELDLTPFTLFKVLDIFTYRKSKNQFTTCILTYIFEKYISNVTRLEV